MLTNDQIHELLYGEGGWVRLPLGQLEAPVSQTGDETDTWFESEYGYVNNEFALYALTCWAAFEWLPEYGATLIGYHGKWGVASPSRQEQMMADDEPTAYHAVLAAVRAVIGKEHPNG